MNRHCFQCMFVLTLRVCNFMLMSYHTQGSNELLISFCIKIISFYYQNLITDRCMFRMNLTCWFDQRLWIWRHGIHYRLIGKVNPLPLLHFSKVSFENLAEEKEFLNKIFWKSNRLWPFANLPTDCNCARLFLYDLRAVVNCKCFWFQDNFI